MNCRKVRSGKQKFTYKTGMSPAESRMMGMIDQSQELKEPRLWQPHQNLPDLPQLGVLARQKRSEGQQVADMTAGDIANTKKGLNPDFIKHFKDCRYDLKKTDGTPVFAYHDGELYDGLPARYELGFPEVMDTVAQNFGIDIDKTPYKGFQTVAGRTALAMAFMGLLERCKQKHPDQAPAVILDAFVWSGYQPLFRKLGIQMIHAPANSEQGLSMSAESLKETFEMAKKKNLAIAGVVPIVPSNPHGHTIDFDELVKIATISANEDTALFFDIFYAALARKGLNEAAPMGRLSKTLPPEVLKYIGFLTGETKVISSNKKTGTIIWFAPKGHEDIATIVNKTAMDEIHRPLSTYPRIDEAWGQYALHTYRSINPEADHIHEAMGERYQLIEANRQKIREIANSLNLGIVGQDSFYMVMALTADDGETLIRNSDGSPVHDPIESIQTLSRYGILGAPGRLFNPTSATSSMIRVSAASNAAELSIFENGLKALVDNAKKRM